MNIKQAAFYKLATVRCAINHVLRMRAMQKQAEMPGYLESSKLHAGTGAYNNSYEKQLADSANSYIHANGITDPTEAANIKENLRQLGVLSDMGYAGDNLAVEQLGNNVWTPGLVTRNLSHPGRQDGLNNLLYFDSQSGKPGNGISQSLDYNRSQYFSNPEANVIGGHASRRGKPVPEGNWH